METILRNDPKVTSVLGPLCARACVIHLVFRNFGVFFRWVLLRFERAVTPAIKLKTQNNTRMLNKTQKNLKETPGL